MALIILGIYILTNIILLHKTKKFRNGNNIVTIRIGSLVSIIMFLLSMLVLAFGAMEILKDGNLLYIVIPIIYFFILLFISYKFICLYITNEAIIFGYNAYLFKEIKKIEIRKIKNKYHITIYIKGTTLYFKLSYLNKKKLLESLHGKVLCINL